MRTPIFAAIAITLALAGSAVAETCYTTSPTTATVPLGMETPWGGGGTLYLAVDECTGQIDGCVFSVWLYEELNGLPGLQRDDNMWSDIRACDGTPADLRLF